MTRRTLGFVLLVAVWAAGQGGPAMAQTRDCEKTRQAWEMDPRMPKGCHCPPGDPTGTPQCPSAFSGGAFAGTPNSLAATMASSLIGALFAAAFAPIETDTSALEAQRAAEEAARKQAEALNAKFLADWKAFQAHAAQARLGEKARAADSGRGLLDRMHGAAGSEGASPPAAPTPSGSIAGFKWETATPVGASYAPLGRAPFDTSGLRDWQRALCAAYLSQEALSAAASDLERARFLDDQSAHAMAGQPIEVACVFPRLAGLPEPGRPEPSAEQAAPPMAEAIKALELIQVRARDLQDLDARLRGLRDARSNTLESREQAEAAVARARAEVARARPDDTVLMAEIQRRLAEAERQRDEATRRLADLDRDLDELNQKKEEIRRELESVRDRMQGGGPAD